MATTDRYLRAKKIEREVEFKEQIARTGEKIKYRLKNPKFLEGPAFWDDIKNGTKR